jgi:hypothetical protein
MDREEAIEAMQDLGVDDITYLEDGVFIAVYIHDTLLEEMVRILEITQKIDNS